MSRPRRQQAPDWPKSLQLPPPLPTPEPERAPAALLSAAGGANTQAAQTTVRPAILAFLFGLTKDGRHLAAEVQVEGTRIVALSPLCTTRYPEQASNAWETCAFVRMAHLREYTATEKAANERQGGKVALSDVAEGHAVALVQKSGKTVALAMEVEGAVVTEPKVLGTGNRLYAWQEAHAYAQRWFLPRRKKR